MEEEVAVVAPGGAARRSAARDSMVSLSHTQTLSRIKSMHQRGSESPVALDGAGGRRASKRRSLSHAAPVAPPAEEVVVAQESLRAGGATRASGASAGGSAAGSDASTRNSLAVIDGSP